jgi:hypothetical protein
MQTRKNFKAGPPRKTRTKVLKVVLVLLLVLIVLTFFLVPMFVSSEKGQKIILAKINNRIDGEANFASLSMSWWKGIEVTDFSFNDHSGQTLIEAKQITTKPHYSSILFGSLSFGKTIVDQPKVEVNLEGQQAERPEDYRQELPMAKKREGITLPVKKINLVVNNGNLKVTDQQGQTVQLSKINSKVNLRPPGQQTSFDIDMTVVDRVKKSQIHTEGQINPGPTQTGWSLKGINGDLTIEVNDLDISSLGPIFTLAGVDFDGDGDLSANIRSKIKDGRFKNLSGTIKGKNLDISSPQFNGDKFKTSILDVAVNLNADREFINIDKLQVQSDWINAEASGVVPTTFKSLSDFVKADSIYNLEGSFKCDLAAALSQMPRTFGLREQTRVTSGQLSGNIQTSTQAGQREIHGQANLAELAGVVSGKKIALSEPVTAEVEITSDKAGINFDKLEVSSSFAKIGCTGTTELLKYNADVSLAKLQAELGQFIDIGPYQMAGRVLGEGTISSKEDKITAAGSSVVENLRLSSTEGVSASESKAQIDYSVAIRPDEKIADVNFIKAEASVGRVTIKQAVFPLEEKADQAMKLTASANSIDLEKLQPFAVLFTSFPQETQLAGTAESIFSISSKEDTYTIKTDATKIKNLKLLSPGQEPFIQDEVLFIFDGDHNPTQDQWAVRKLKLISPDINFQFDFEKSVQAGKTKLEGRVDYEWDWSAVGAVASAFLPAGLNLKGQSKDSVDFSSEYPAGQTEKLLDNLNTKAKLAFEQADYMGLNFGPTEVDFKIQNGLLEIAPLSSTVNKGRFKFAGYADLGRKPLLLETSQPIQIFKDIQLDDASRKLLKYLNPIFASAVNIDGVANLHCERLAIPLAGATKKDIELTGTVSIDKLHLKASDLLTNILSAFGERIRGQELTIRPTRFVVQDGFVKYENMQIDVGDNPVNFQGTIGLDKSLDMIVILPYTLNGRTIRIGEERTSGRIPLPLGETIDNPKLDLTKLLEQQAIRKGWELFEDWLKDR